MQKTKKQILPQRLWYGGWIVDVWVFLVWHENELHRVNKIPSKQEWIVQLDTIIDPIDKRDAILVQHKTAEYLNVLISHAKNRCVENKYSEGQGDMPPDNYNILQKYQNVEESRLCKKKKTKKSR